VGDWWLYILVFLFGYVTCQTFYFMKGTRITLKLLKSSKVVYLSMLVKAIENYAASEALMLQYMNDSKTPQNIKEAFGINFEAEKDLFKRKTIKYLIDSTPHTFKENIGFYDWDTAMLYLSLNRDEAYDFWRLKDD